jgi:TPP-dependent indolepyruvate ferredoxin oxidoreductase alpha subunit
MSENGQLLSKGFPRLSTKDESNEMDEEREREKVEKKEVTSRKHTLCTDTPARCAFRVHHMIFTSDNHVSLSLDLGRSLDCLFVFNNEISTQH